MITSRYGSEDENSILNRRDIIYTVYNAATGRVCGTFATITLARWFITDELVPMFGSEYNRFKILHTGAVY
jgi:hypothetical protein